MLIYFSDVIVYVVDRPCVHAGFVNRVMLHQLLFFQ